jgi:phenylcoumaran benzylic ether reductase
LVLFCCYQRFLPSEFGIDVDRHHAVEPVASFFGQKAKIRRAIEAEGIPYTYISSNAFAGYFLPTLGQQNVTSPPRDKVVILGDGNVKGNIVQNLFKTFFLSTWTYSIMC